MQKTYLKHTAFNLLKTARIGPSKAGLWQVWVNVPKLGECIALIGARGDGWGCLVRDVLVLEDAYGSALRLATSSKSLARLESLLAECEANQVAELRAAGELI